VEKDKTRKPAKSNTKFGLQLCLYIRLTSNPFIKFHSSCYLNHKRIQEEKYLLLNGLL
jgi:hypothetical protein